MLYKITAKVDNGYTVSQEKRIQVTGALWTMARTISTILTYVVAELLDGHEITLKLEKV